LYLLVDLPGLSRVTDVTFEAHDFVADETRTAINGIELVVGGRPLVLDLTRLASIGTS
jgi:hypothetical protein